MADSPKRMNEQLIIQRDVSIKMQHRNKAKQSMINVQFLHRNLNIGIERPQARAVPDQLPPRKSPRKANLENDVLSPFD